MKKKYIQKDIDRLNKNGYKIIKLSSRYALARRYSINYKPYNLFGWIKKYFPLYDIIQIDIKIT